MPSLTPKVFPSSGVRQMLLRVNPKHFGLGGLFELAEVAGRKYQASFLYGSRRVDNPPSVP